MKSRHVSTINSLTHFIEFTQLNLMISIEFRNLKSIMIIELYLIFICGIFREKFMKNNEIGANLTSPKKLIYTFFVANSR
uniref:Uncharacterized protein n=1 Tax=Glossina palpalis gambiensis TaxID=67801 RepID=A0A1B0BRZ2_9MUSC